MSRVKNSLVSDVLLLFSILISLVITPWANADSMIIPKLALLFIAAMFLIIPLIGSFKFVALKNFRIELTLVLLILIQLLFVLVISDSPWEQQIFGRTGRGLGFICQFSLLVIFLFMIFNSKNIFSDKLLFGLVFSCAISSCYSLIQFLGKDLFAWNTKTNGIIGTLGNPNFQSSFAAMALLPTFAFFWKRKYNFFTGPILIILLLFIIYITKSVQGYISATASVLTFFLAYFFKKRKYFLAGSLGLIGLIVSFISILGMTNNGPLRYFLYKPSVSSRGDFWRSAFNAAKDNPLFGHGLESFADNYLMFRDLKAANGVGEFTDNAHNIYLEYAATAGFPLAILILLINLVVIYSFISYLKSSINFDYKVVALFSSWTVFQLQSLISPANISMLAWNSLIGGYIIGIEKNTTQLKLKNTLDSRKTQDNNKNRVSLILPLVAGLVMYPLFNTDRLQLQSSQTRDALLAVKVSKMYPESTLRYSQLGRAMLESNLPNQALEIGRSAVIFNPNAVSAWALILANPAAPVEERKVAASQIMKLDPFNKIVQEIKF